MKASFISKVIASSIIAVGAIATSLPAQAAELINGWSYARDDYSYDGSDSFGFGANSRYDIYGMGFKVVGNEMWVGINSSNQLNGIGSSPNVGFGDLFLDFNNGTSTFAQSQGALVGIRFAPNSDNIGTIPLGVYTNVSGKSVAANNNGYPNLNTYNNNVKNATGGNSRFGDLLWTDPYYAPYTSGTGSLPNVINTGTAFNGGNLRYLSSAELADSLFPTTVNLASPNKNILGFAFTLPDALKGKDFLATLGFDCSNDTIGVKYKAVPVPPAIAGIIAAGVIGGLRSMKRKNQIKATAA